MIRRVVGGHAVRRVPSAALTVIIFIAPVRKRLVAHPAGVPGRGRGRGVAGEGWGGARFVHAGLASLATISFHVSPPPTYVESQAPSTHSQLLAPLFGSIDLYPSQASRISLVAIHSLTASSGDNAPRGVGFLLEPNRLNVAISRAQCLSIMVGSPSLTSGIANTLKEAEQINLLCSVVINNSSSCN